MKEFIVGISVFLVLMFFPTQWILSQINHYKIQSVTNITHNAAQKARIDGYFKEETINQMTNDIATVLSVDESKIKVEVTTTPKYRLDNFDQREMISYEIRIPISRVIAMNSFLGIKNEDNQFEYVIKGEVTSELLLP